MARIAGINIPMNKHVWIGLTHSIFGVGRRAQGLSCSRGRRSAHQGEGSHRDRGQCDPLADRKVRGRGRPAPRSLDEHQTPDGSGLASRHPSSRGLPVRGQRTRTNARTRKGPRKQAVKLNAPPGKASGDTGATHLLRTDGNPSEQALVIWQSKTPAVLAAAPDRWPRKPQEGTRTCSMRSRTCTPPSTTRSSRSPTARATRCPGRPPAAVASAVRARARRLRRRWPPRRPAPRRRSTA